MAEIRTMTSWLKKERGKDGRNKNMTSLLKKERGKDGRNKNDD